MYLCPNNLVAVWKSKIYELKTFISFLNNHNYFLMGYVCLLGTAQFLRSGNQIVHQCSHFLSYIALGMVLVFYENPTSRRQDVLKEMSCNVTLELWIRWVVVATRSRRQLTPKDNADSGEQFITGAPKAGSPLSQGPRPVFVKTLHILSACPNPPHQIPWN